MFDYGHTDASGNSLEVVAGFNEAVAGRWDHVLRFSTVQQEDNEETASTASVRDSMMDTSMGEGDQMNTVGSYDLPQELRGEYDSDFSFHVFSDTDSDWSTLVASRCGLETIALSAHPNLILGVASAVKCHSIAASFSQAVVILQTSPVTFRLSRPTRPSAMLHNVASMRTRQRMLGTKSVLIPLRRVAVCTCMSSVIDFTTSDTVAGPTLIRQAMDTPWCLLQVS